MKLGFIFLVLFGWAAGSQAATPWKPDSDALILLHFDELDSEGVTPDEGGFTEGFRIEPANVPSAFAQGQEGWGRAFDAGVGGAVCSAPLPVSFGLSLGTELTAEAKILADREIRGPAYLFSIGPKGTLGTVLAVYLSSQTEVHVLRYANGAWRDDIIDLEEEMPIHEWVHFALVVTSGQGEFPWTFSVYLDGRKVGSKGSEFFAGSETPDHSVLIGSFGTIEGSFPGLIDEFRLSSSARLPEAAL
jgi:hypothetical protein